MRSSIAIAVLIAAAVAAQPTSAQFYPVGDGLNDGKADNPGNSFFVKNASGVALRCSYKVGNVWRGPYPLRNGQEYYVPPRQAQSLAVSCQRPVETKVYTLERGKRNVLLRDNDRVIRLRLVTAR